MSEPRADDQDPRWSALSQWRQLMIKNGEETSQSLRDRDLKMVLRSARTGVDDIRSMLPGTLARHAEAIAAILARVGDDHPGLAAVPDTAPPAAAEPGSTELAAQTGSALPDADPAPRAARPEPATHGQVASGTDFTRHLATELPTAPAHRVSGRFRMIPTSGSGALTDDAALGAAQAGARRDGWWELNWPPYVPDAGSGPTVVLYRLVSSDEHPPYSPDHARLVVASTDTSTVDDEPHSAAVRHYQVWVNTGATRSEALAAQPRLHADASLVGCPTGVSIRDDSGQVVGRWDAPPGATAVWICRLPAGADTRHDMQYRILAAADNLTGFVDSAVSRGTRYRYRLYTEAIVAGQTSLSDPIDVSVEVSAVLEAVTDMAVSNSADGAVELSWPRPAAGKVIIYRTESRPNAISGAVAESALAGAGLTTDLEVTRPVTADAQDRAVMRGVSWPDAWSRVYFTPVTVLAGQALMGTPVSTVRVGSMGEIDLADYCNLQVLTFAWPAGASSVEMQIAPRNYDAREGLTGRPVDIGKEHYEKYGGHLLAGRDRLPATGCSLHLAAVAHSGGRRIRGPWRSIDYAGMLRVKYRLAQSANVDGRTTAAIVIQSEFPVPRSPAFVLVHNQGRLPLAADDGDALDVVPYDAQARQYTGPPAKELRPTQLTQDGGTERWIVELTGLTGWVRLFFNSYDTRAMRGRALIDPAVHELRIDRTQAPR